MTDLADLLSQKPQTSSLAFKIFWIAVGATFLSVLFGAAFHAAGTEGVVQLLLILMDRSSE